MSITSFSLSLSHSLSVPRNCYFIIFYHIHPYLFLIIYISNKCALITVLLFTSYRYFLAVSISLRVRYDGSMSHIWKIFIFFCIRIGKYCVRYYEFIFIFIFYFLFFFGIWLGLCFSVLKKKLHHRVLLMQSLILFSDFFSF